jgi:hypothetical protein
MAIARDTLGLAGEFAAASELCRRGVYAQLTLGNRKRTDLLIESDRCMIRVQVKAKQGRVWPASKGVHGKDIVLVLVDYEKKADTDRPDFYILTPEDWGTVVTATLNDTGKVDRGEVTLSAENIPTWKDGYVGMSLRPEDVAQFKDTWDKIVALVNRTA